MAAALENWDKAKKKKKNHMRFNKGEKLGGLSVTFICC